MNRVLLEALVHFGLLLALGGGTIWFWTVGLPWLVRILLTKSG